jgi:hypothetical protein
VTRKNILFLYSRIPSFTNAVRDYVNAFAQHSSHHIHYFDTDSGPLECDLGAYGAIIFNYCFWARRSSITPEMIARVAAYGGPKIAIFQDEQDTIRWHRQHVVLMGIRAIVTVVNPEVWRAALPADFFENLIFLRALTGYLPELQTFGEIPPLPMAGRRWWIGYRGRPIPYQYGRLTREKFIIGERMREICEARHIPNNIATNEEDRLYDEAWYELIRNSRLMLGTESGTDVFDFEGGLWDRVDTWLRLHPQTTFEEVEEKFLSGIEKIAANQISPRLFEAIALRTGLLLFEGEYSDVLKPWTHYIPLKKDFSNIDEVLTAVDDLDGIEAMVARAWRDVVLSGKYSFSAYVKRIDDLIERMHPGELGRVALWGLVGWREDTASAVSPLPGQSLQIPTAAPLRHFDQIPDPVVTVQVNWGALHRLVMRRYESVLYSPIGRKCRAYLQGNAFVYAVARRCVRLLTGRW